MIKNKVFVFLACIILVFEILIATGFKNTSLRPVFGDFLVVILMYATLRGFTNLSKFYIGIGVLITAYIIEFLQWVDILDILGIEKTITTHLILGSTFDWNDILAYSLGVGFALIIDKIITKPLSVN